MDDRRSVALLAGRVGPDASQTCSGFTSISSPVALDFLRACVLVSSEHLETPPPAQVRPRTEPGNEIAPFAGVELRLLEDSPAATYLVGRHIPLDLARHAGVGWRVLRPRGASVSRAYVGFPFKNRRGLIVACQYRAIAAEAECPHHTEGSKSAGIFAAGPLAYASLVAIVEAPIDALSLASVGVASIALGGTGLGTDWLAEILRRRTVLLGQDRDHAGEEAAARLREPLPGPGTLRMRPRGKDWNEDLGAGCDEMREHIRGLCQSIVSCSVWGAELTPSERAAGFGLHFECTPDSTTSPW
jgi:hypothetical protein